MKLNALALVGALLAAPVVAQPIYIDIGGDYGGNANTAAGTNTTGWFNELTYVYNSWSTITDVDGNFGLSVGDTFLSTGGILGNNGYQQFNFADDMFSNRITGFNPNQIGPDFINAGPSDNGYNDGWSLTFGFNNLKGTVTSFTADGAPIISWQSGTVSMYITNTFGNCFAALDTSCFVRMFDMEVLGGNDIGNGTLINGYLTNFNTTDTSINGKTAGSFFNTEYNGMNKSFLDIHNDLVSKGQQQLFSFVIDQNAGPKPVVVDGSYDIVSKTFKIEKATHDGSLVFDVPEPTSIAVLGLGLLGLGLSRRKSAK